MSGVPVYHAGLLIGALVVTWAAIFGLRMAGPSNLLDDDQLRPAAYVLDVISNGNWLVQRDETGDITSKPPLYTWIVALTALAGGGLSELTLYLPGALAVLATSLLVFVGGSRLFGCLPAFVGAAALLLSNPGFKQVHLARTDAVFALLVFSAAWLAMLASQRRAHWAWFWVLAGLATLTKGPLGVVLPAAGLLAGFLPSAPGARATTGARGVAAEHAAGMVLYLVLTVGWFYPAWRDAGQPLIDKMIGRELVGHVAGGDGGDALFSKPHQPPLYFLSRFAPWSLLAVVAMWRVLRRRENYGASLYEARFLSLYLAGGVILFAIAPHQRFDHQFPLLPAAALLAGSELTRLLGRRAAAIMKVYPFIAIVAIAGAGTYYHFDTTKEKLRSAASRVAAGEILEKVPGHFPLMHAGATMAVQFHLGTMRQRVTVDQAVEAVDSGRAAYVLVRDEETASAIRKKCDAKVYRVGQWSAEAEGKPFLQLLSNREGEIRWHDRMFTYINGVRIKSDYVELMQAGGHSFDFKVLGVGNLVSVVNTNEEPKRIRVALHRGESVWVQEEVVATGGGLDVTFPATAASN